MYEQAASNWAIGLYSLLDPTKFLPFLPNLWNKQAIGSRYPNDTKVRDTDVLVGYLILFWTILYLVYEKCLNVSPTIKLWLLYIFLLKQVCSTLSLQAKCKSLDRVLTYIFSYPRTFLFKNFVLNKVIERWKCLLFSEQSVGQTKYIYIYIFLYIICIY